MLTVFLFSGIIINYTYNFSSLAYASKIHLPFIFHWSHIHIRLMQR
jgi:hypothetical protein